MAAASACKPYGYAIVNIWQQQIKKKLQTHKYWQSMSEDNTHHEEACLCQERASFIQPAASNWWNHDTE